MGSRRQRIERLGVKLSPVSWELVNKLEARLRAVSKRDDAVQSEIAKRNGKLTKTLREKANKVARDLHDVTTEILDLPPTVRTMRAKGLLLSLTFGLDLIDHDSGTVHSFEDRVVLVIAKDLMNLRYGQ